MTIFRIDRSFLLILSSVTALICSFLMCGRISSSQLGRGVRLTIWRNASQKLQSELAEVIAKRNLFVGATTTDVVNSLGDPTGSISTIHYLFTGRASMTIVLDGQGYCARVRGSCYDWPPILDTPFLRNKWLSGNVGERQLMARDVVESRILIGKATKEIVELLGPPDKVFQSITYRIGDDDEPGSGVLQFSLDGNRRVNEVEIVCQSNLD